MNFTLTVNIALSFPCWCNCFNYVTFIIQQGWSYSSREMIFSKQVSIQAGNKQRTRMTYARINNDKIVTSLWLFANVFRKKEKNSNTSDLIKFSRFTARIKSKIINPREAKRWRVSRDLQTLSVLLINFQSQPDLCPHPKMVSASQWGSHLGSYVYRWQSSSAWPLDFERQWLQRERSAANL